MSQVLVDIITITFNNIEGLKKTYKSVIAQDYGAYNWLVIDGGSSDGTLEFLQAIDDKLKVKWVSEKDAGIYDAMNKGIELSVGEYIIFMNAGDLFNSTDILTTIFTDLNSAPTLIYGGFYRELKGGELSHVSAKPLWYIYHSLPTSHQAIFYHSESIKKIKYDLSYKICGDYYLTAKLVNDKSLLDSEDYLKVKEIISIFEYNGVSRNNLKGLFEESAIVQLKVFGLPMIWRKLSYFFKYLRNLNL